MRQDIPQVERAYLAVPHAERHEAKALGARWDAVLQGVGEQGRTATQSVELAPAV